MSAPYQIDGVTDEDFELDLKIYRELPRPEMEEVSGRIAVLRESMGIRRALHEATAKYRALQTLAIVMTDGAQEYDDILVGNEIYQEIKRRG